MTEDRGNRADRTERADRHEREVREDREDREERVGIFPNWAWLFWAVVIYGILVIAALTLFTRLLDFGAGQ